jgi:hypothetical protein
VRCATRVRDSVVNTDQTRQQIGASGKEGAEQVVLSVFCATTAGLSAGSNPVKTNTRPTPLQPVELALRDAQHPLPAIYDPYTALSIKTGKV